ncbi:radical SAM-modified peptide, FtsH ternary system-associated [Streptomyces sp. NPDC086182]|jgi:hypothetical protein
MEGTPATGADRRFVEHLDDLIQPEEYPDHPRGRLVRVRITVTADGLRVDGDAFRPEVLERLLKALGPETVEQMLCG